MPEFKQIQDGQYNNLLIADETCNPDEPECQLLYIPDTSEHDHHHILLNPDQVKMIIEWGRSWLKEHGHEVDSAE